MSVDNDTGQIAIYGTGSTPEDCGIKIYQPDGTFETEILMPKCGDERLSNINGLAQVSNILNMVMDTRNLMHRTIFQIFSII